MNISIYIFLSLCVILFLSSGCIFVIKKRIELFEKKLILDFKIRSNIFPGLYEVVYGFMLE